MIAKLQVSFKKVKEQLGFEPFFSVEYGIKEELIDALKIGLYSDSKSHINKYGNYSINYRL